MGIIKINTRFDVKSARIVCEQKVSVRPIAHHYEEIGQPEYIKWSCPICEEIAKKYPNFILDEDHQFNNFSFTEETERCPVCGINLNWGAPNFAYEHKKEVRDMDVVIKKDLQMTQTELIKIVDGVKRSLDEYLNDVIDTENNEG